MLIDDLRKYIRPYLKRKIKLKDSLAMAFDALFDKDLLCVNIDAIGPHFMRNYLNSKPGNAVVDILKDCFCLLPPAPLLWLERNDCFFEPKNKDGLPYLNLGSLVCLRPFDESDLDRANQAKITIHEPYYTLSIAHLSYAHSNLYSPNVLSTFFLNKEGAYLSFDVDDGFDFCVFQSMHDAIDEERLKKMVDSTHLTADNMIALYAINMMNVKNIVVRERHQKTNSKVVRSIQKRRVLPPVKMHTLDIVVPGQRLIDPDGEAREPSESSSSRPLHLVRGHLADYRFGKGLFGKHKGVFYIPQHARGSIDNGIVKKRYELQSKEG